MIAAKLPRQFTSSKSRPSSKRFFDRIHLIDARFEILRRDLEIALKIQIKSAERKARYQQELAEPTVNNAFLRHSNVGGERMVTMTKNASVKSLSALGLIGHGSSHHLLNAEETENLTIKAGTLTAERAQDHQQSYFWSRSVC